MTKTIAAKLQRREDDTSLILCMAVNGDDSFEERETRDSTALVLDSIYGLFIYVPLSGFLPPTSAEDSYQMREMYLAGGSALAHYFHVMQRAIFGKHTDVYFSLSYFLR